ncbi:MAG: hypothetical protein ACK5TK_00700 [Betaproteobacteria bacterium]
MKAALLAVGGGALLAPTGALSMAPAAWWSAAVGPSLRGLITAAAIAALLWALRRGGPRLAGLLAAFPVTSAPALLWLTVDYGPEAAAAAAQGALYSTGLSAILALAYAHGARRLGPAGSLAVGLLATGAVGLAAIGLQGSAAAVALFVAVALALSARAMPRLHGDAPPRRPARHDVAVGAGCAGLMSTVVLLLAPQLPPQWCGLIASLPLVGTVSTVLVHRQVPPAALAAFLRAYVGGLTARAVFMTALMVALVPLGTVAAWALALAAALAAVRLAGWRASARWTPAAALTFQTPFALPTGALDPAAPARAAVPCVATAAAPACASGRDVSFAPLSSRKDSR